MISPTSILVVDDDTQVRTLLRNMLGMQGYAVSEAANSQQMFAALENEPVSLITLDLNLAGEDGLALAREVHARRNVPIIMITARADDTDRVVGLELGADDYITKPFNPREVLARVRAVLRRYEPSSGAQPIMRTGERDRFVFAGWVLDTGAHELRTMGGQGIELTSAEFNLLKLFVSRPARVLSRDAIMDLLKGHEWTPLDRSIDALVGRLRKKIEPDPQHPSLIKTVRGVGYVFAADVRRT
jgi:DNA-binding response OmpR family regulator